MGKKGRFWVYMVLVASVAIPLSSIFFQISVVRGESMQPTIMDGDRLFVEKISPVIGEIKRFDIVIIKDPRDGKETYVKRVIGLPGEKVSIKNGRIVVNGRVYPEYFYKTAQIYNSKEWEVPKGCYFVLGDNRPVSLDSREFGFVPKELIKGKVKFCIWPLFRFGAF